VATILRGEIWMFDFNPTRGHEQAGKRPALVVSDDLFNAGPAGLVIVLPLTTQSKGVRSHVEVRPPEGGLRKISYIKCEDVRSVSVERMGKRIGAVSPSTLHSVSMRLRILLDL
jgi:mRNA interferase MazF